MANLLAPMNLAWSEVDPGAHPFDASAALDVVRSLAFSTAVPTQPADTAVNPWSHEAGREWTDAATTQLAAHYGDWVCGWRWARDEGDIGGGPIRSWCCPKHSITSPDETLTRVAEAVVEWRGWIEELTTTFDGFGASLREGSVDDREDAWERAVVHVITMVVERTGAGDAWYAHCQQVLEWFLARVGVPAAQADAWIRSATSGVFESWVRPSEGVVAEVAHLVAVDAVTSKNA